MTDGQLPIRQCLFPEAQRKGITLPAYYNRFHDLRKEFSAAYPDSPVNEVEDMLKSKSNIDWNIPLAIIYCRNPKTNPNFLKNISPLILDMLNV